MRRFTEGDCSEIIFFKYNILFDPTVEAVVARKGNGWMEGYGDHKGEGSGCGIDLGTPAGDSRHSLFDNTYPTALIQYW